MSSSNATPPKGVKAISGERAAAGEDSRDTRPERAAITKPVVREVPLGGTVPREEPKPTALVSGDLYVRLEGRIYGPFTAEDMERLLLSGKLTGLEVASPDLHRWTPLAYHPRIVRSRVRDFDRAHDLLRQASALPAKVEVDDEPPLAAIVRRPGRSGSDTGATPAIGTRVPGRRQRGIGQPGGDEG